MSDALCNLGVFDLAALYRRGEVSPVEVVNAHLDRCDRLNPVLNAFLLLLHDSAIQSARAAEALFRAGIDLGPLQGVPVSLKDLIRLRGTRTTAASRVLLQEPPDQTDALLVQRLKASGAVIIGKTNLHEFASGNPDPAGPFGLVQNPRRIGYHPGSSSSGAGAATAAGLGVSAIGTDTGGSVRIPACLCGVAGLKPTAGRISLEGVIPLSWTLDAAGPLARRVSDVAVTFAVCSGQIEDDLNAARHSATSFMNQLDQTVLGWRIGIPKGDYFSKMQPAVAKAFKNTLKLLGDMGCQLIDFDPTGIEEMDALATLIVQSEGSTFHERYRDRDHLYGDGFRERVLAGREVNVMKYLAARRRQLELRKIWLDIVSRFDVVIVPSVPAVAPPHGATTIEIDNESVPFRQLLARFTRPFNILGWPALTLPNGVTEEGLPTGVQIAGPPAGETRILTLGHQLERALGLVDKLGIEPRQPT